MFRTNHPLAGALQIIGVILFVFGLFNKGSILASWVTIFAALFFFTGVVLGFVLKPK